MADSRLCVTNGSLSTSGSGRNDCVDLRAGGDVSLSRPEGSGQYVAISPKGVQISIPKELFVALSDFMMTRKCPGSITIQFRGGEILCVESLAKKTYRNHS
jgi:hypothetical protein